MATLTGTPGPDTLSGTADDDLITGRGGADRLEGLADHDAVFGGGGDDRLFGDGPDGPLPASFRPGEPPPGDNLIRGGSGDDSVTAGFGADTVLGGAGDDSVFGGGAFILRGREFGMGGPSFIPSLDGADLLLGGPGKDTLDGSGGADTIGGGVGDDLVVGGPGVDLLLGGPDADRFAFRPPLSPVGRPDLGAGEGARDVVRDFEQGRDLLDLSALVSSAGPPLFLGSDPFPDDAPLPGAGGLRVRYEASAEGDRTLVQINPVAARTAEGEFVFTGEVELAGVFRLAASDFFPALEAPTPRPPAFAVFAATEGATGRELWATDGTAEGTRPVADIWPGGGDSNPGGFGPPGSFFALGDGRLLFAAADPFRGAELWVTDGTAEGTRLVADINRSASGFGGSFPSNFASLGGGRALFTATDGATGTEPWITDGTAEGTRPVADINPGPSSSTFGGFASLGGGRAVFAADSGGTGSEPWVTDGTAEGTRPLADQNPGVGGGFPFGFVSLGDGRAVFAADDGALGREPWVTDGTAEGTRPLADLNPGLDGSFPSTFASLGGGRALFTATDGATGSEPWVTDGTAEGTRPVADINPGPSSSTFSGFVILGDGRAVFAADDGTLGREPWITDGTAEGTRPLADTWPGGGSGNPSGFAILGDGRVLFSAMDPFNGTELWVSDLTAEGTRLVANINRNASGFASSSPGSIVALGGGRAVFAADDGALGREPWITDGTAEGTRLVADINPGALSSNPVGFALASLPDLLA